jgi:chaperonin GroEL
MARRHESCNVAIAMPHKRVLFQAQARDKLLRGTAALADAVRVTLGPKSRSVLIDKAWGSPIVCNDGVTIAKEFQLADPEENLGAKVLKQAAVRTGEQVGDGTSTATLLAHAIWSEGLRNVVAGASAVELKRGFERGARIAIETLRSAARPLTSKKERAQVATISAHNDESIGAVVADASERVGKDGVITVEEAKGVETELEVVDGLQFDHGYTSAYFVNQPEQMTCSLEEPVILLYDKRVTSMQGLLPLLELIVQARKPLLLIAEDVEAEALATLVLNKLRGTLSCCAVKAPGFGDRRKQMLEDIAILTGGKVISEELGAKLENTTLDDLGKARRVEVTREHTTIVGGGGQPGAVKGRCDELRRQIKDTKSDYDREKLEERLAKLAGGVAVIRVGAASETEMKSRKEAFDDAISATKAALAEGIVPGAGLALLRCIPALEAEARKCEGDARTALRVLARALEAPARQIAKNSEADDGVVVERMRSGDVGFDAATGNYVDLFEAGIIDATKVVRCALENAVSVAGTLLLTEATMIEVNEPEAKDRARDGEEGFG